MVCTEGAVSKQPLLIFKQDWNLTGILFVVDKVLYLSGIQ